MLNMVFLETSLEQQAVIEKLQSSHYIEIEGNAVIDCVYSYQQMVFIAKQTVLTCRH